MKRLVAVLALGGCLAVPGPAAGKASWCQPPRSYYIAKLRAVNVSCGFAVRLAHKVNRDTDCYRWFTYGRGNVSDGHTCTASHSRRVRWTNVA